VRQGNYPGRKGSRCGRVLVRHCHEQVRLLPGIMHNGVGSKRYATVAQKAMAFLLISQRVSGMEGLEAIRGVNMTLEDTHTTPWQLPQHQNPFRLDL
jgi:hypothetical protein